MTATTAPKQGLKGKVISWAMKKMMANAGGGGGGPGSGGGPPPWVKAMLAGGGAPGGAPPSIFSRPSKPLDVASAAAMLGDAVALAIRTLKDSQPYQHEINDALVKMHLNSVQFAKNAGLIEEYVKHDIKTMQPMLQRLKGMIDKTGEKEIALAGIFDRTTCLYQLCIDLEKSPGVRTFTFPYTTVLDIARRIGQFDMTDKDMHELWLKPRLLGYAEALGVKISVSDIGRDNKVTVKLVE
jgi:hypothetical protein